MEPPSIQELFLDGRLIDRAMRAAVREALLRHKKAGAPIVVQRRGKIVWIKAKDIKIPGMRARRSAVKRASKPGKGPRKTSRSK